MGSMASELTRKSIDEFGEEFWKTHVATVNLYWEVISTYCNTIDFGNKIVKIYQDGMVADGAIALKIMEDSVQAGSKNYEVISKLVNRGAIIQKTEDLELVKKELDMLKSIPSSGSLIRKIIKIIKFKISRHKLLVQRDKFIAESINKTLKKNEIGIIFIGAYHRVLDKLPKDIAVKEMKEVNKIREYQKLLPFHAKKKERFKELTLYLKKQVVDER
ncbi:hypothetical protein PI23P_02437 [Polaribacter irgensii 23-P]|uniref:Uncharacterized protein n=2 Tax=Polaribacter TaxID=52959 RepID=A4BWH4_9FLAO|nr:hypothetical protein PI23P_02437 [Polaribacter irgensii 23-P]